MAANAAAAGLAYRTEGRDHGNTFDLHRLLRFAKACGKQNPLLDLAYAANFAEERSIFDDEQIVELAVEAGLRETEACAVLADGNASAEAVREDGPEAALLGGFGGRPTEMFT